MTLARGKSPHLLPNDDRYLLIIPNPRALTLNPKQVSHATCLSTFDGIGWPITEKRVTTPPLVPSFLVRMHFKTNTWVDASPSVIRGMTHVLELTWAFVCCALRDSGIPNGFGEIGRQLLQHEASKYFWRDLTARVVYGAGSYGIMKKIGNCALWVFPLWLYLGIQIEYRWGWDYAVIRDRPLTILWPPEVIQRLHMAVWAVRSPFGLEDNRRTTLRMRDHWL